MRGMEKVARADGRPPCGGVDRNYTAGGFPIAATVAPHAGAWIETEETAMNNPITNASPPMRGRGSKPPRAQTLPLTCRSPPMRGRGSKPMLAGYTEAGPSRPPCGGVDRNIPKLTRNGAYPSRPPCGGVDRNMTTDGEFLVVTGRPPCGGVDRNLDMKRVTSGRPVAPHAGAWIETAKNLTRRQNRRRRPPCGGVDRNMTPEPVPATLEVAPHAGAWIETSPLRSAVRLIASPPMRGRGSKRKACARSPWPQSRPPCGGVDRNKQWGGIRPKSNVAPHAGAWIETTSAACSMW